MSPIQIEVVSDVVCPWCFIGKRHLDTALAAWHHDYPEHPVAVTWRPYFLNPDTPVAGEPYRPFLEHKFGSAQEVDAILARVAAAGWKAGVAFAFERISLRANTLHAHRLIHHAQKVGTDGPAVEQLVERLFAANFQNGDYVGDIGVLTRIAGACGLEVESVRTYLESDQDTNQVRAIADEARRMGIGSVPSFIFNQRFAVTGAQAPELLRQALEQCSGYSGCLIKEPT
jgi:predicted DsbA family dithiol-disulfide isomerase